MVDPSNMVIKGFSWLFMVITSYWFSKSHQSDPSESIPCVIVVFLARRHKDLKLC